MNPPETVTQHESARDAFFVGYLKTPSLLRRFLAGVVPAVIAIAAGLAAWVALRHNDPGAGVWDDATSRQFEGRVVLRPYAMLRIRGATPAAPVETLPLVEVGKFGGGRRAQAFDGAFVQVSGWLLERDGRRMIEMEPGESIRRIDPTPANELPPERATSLGPRTLRGEIVDSKCFLGAMKPGDGKTHKACATLCIAGGIPPVLVTVDAVGKRSYFLLVGGDGGPLDERILPFVADSIEVRGELESRDGVLILKIDPAKIFRL